MAKKSIHKVQVKDSSKTVDSLFKDIRVLIDRARDTAYRSVNVIMVRTYWEIGRMIFEKEQQGEERAEYGSYLLKELSVKLTAEFGKGYNRTNLAYMRQFHSSFPIVHALREQLSWTHYRLLLKVDKESAREYYLDECVNCNWSTRELERQINSMYYERLLLSGKKRSLVKKEAESKKEELQPAHFIKDPYVLDFLNLKPNTAFYEQELEQGLIDKLQEFLLELGKGFSFVGRQYRLTAEEEHFYVDLVFYNYILKCFLLIDLKAGKLTHQDVGQMDMYVRYFEENVRQESDNPTIGLILCAEKNKAVVKYSLLRESKQIFASKYKLYLPSEKELEQELERERQQIEIEKRIKTSENN